MLKPRHPTATPIERGFRRLVHGDVHYRAAGQGPVLLALHESPRSSLSLLPVMEALCDRYRVIAIDTPGYGLSDPLPGDTPTLDDFLDIIAAFLDDIGVRKAAVYGAHTGAALATAFALREPARVSALVLDGLSAFTQGEVEDFRDKYLTPYAPAWDGSHIMRLWSRAKDLYTWFPWYEQTAEHRLSSEPADVGLLHRSALGFLQSGVHYSKAYILAASFQPNQVIRDLRMPATVIARPDDLIADHLARLEPGPSWEIVWLGDTAEDWIEAMQQGLDKGVRPDRAGVLSPSTQGSVFLPVDEGWMHAYLSGPMDGPLRIAVPALPGNSMMLAARQSALHPGDRLAVISLPGCGWSDPLTGAHNSLEGAMAALDEVSAHLGRAPDTVVGEGASALIADLWVRRRDWALEVERLDPPVWLTDPAVLPDRPLLTRVDPSWDGSHLTAAWFQLRDLQLYGIPPGAGRPVRRAGDLIEPSELDHLFRSYVEGPESADLLAQVIDHLRSLPHNAAEPRMNDAG